MISDEIDGDGDGPPPPGPLDTNTKLKVPSTSDASLSSNEAKAAADTQKEQFEMSIKHSTPAPGPRTYYKGEIPNKAGQYARAMKYGQRYDSKESLKKIKYGPLMLAPPAVSVLNTYPTPATSR